jgi:gamma-glutamyltranspeptidase/glutathione hydrolase
VLLNNGVYWLNPHSDHPNAIQGGVLPLNNMSPLVITKNNQAWCALGASGGRRIMPAMHQVLSLMMGKGLALDQAIAYPRIDTSESGRVICDPRLSSSIRAALKPYGEVVTWPAIANPHAYAIVAGVMKISHNQGLMAAINPYLPLTTAAAC